VAISAVTCQVTAEIATGEASVEIAVTDSGPGVPVADRDRIFERFFRLASGNGHSGAGLGLPISRWIAERHGGRLTLESSAPAAARFVVKLPYTPPAVSVAAHSPARD
jgi:signal transduction histidine kinase